MNVHLHCIVSNWKGQAKCPRCSSWKYFCGRPWSCKRKIVVFARHYLRLNATNFSKYFLKVIRLKWWKLNTTRREEIIRDAFITGVSSQTIRQRLLEKNLTLRTKQPKNRRILSNQRRSTSPSIHSNLQGLFVIFGKKMFYLIDGVLQLQPKSASAAVRKKKCFFCGGQYHIRRRCHAGNSPVATGGGSGWLSPQTKLQASQNWNMKHY